jgi:hypothetical protein
MATLTWTAATDGQWTTGARWTPAQVATTGGTASGTIWVGDIIFANSQTLDNVVASSIDSTIDAEATLTLGRDFVLNVVEGAYNLITQYPTTTFAGETILNEGTILAQSTTEDVPLGLGFPLSAINFVTDEFENAGVIAAVDLSGAASRDDFFARVGEAQVEITDPLFFNAAGGLIELGENIGASMLTIAPAVNFTNDGTILTQAPSSNSGGYVTIETALNGNGTLEMGGNSQIILQTSAASTQLLDFIGPASLELDAPASVHATINGFAPGDDIFIPVDVTGVSYTNGDLRLQVVGSSTTFDLGITGPYSLSDFDINAAGRATNIDIACFATGTLLETARGMVPVEALRVGDAMLLADNITSPVVWVGHRCIDCRHHPAPHTVWPVRVTAGAFGPGTPQRDLCLSPDHAIFASGVLIPVKYLVNGTSITRSTMGHIEYWHVELPRHAILLAEGLSVESLLPGNGRAEFDGGGRVIALNPHWNWESTGAAPLVVTGPQLEAVRRQLSRIAATHAA